MSRLRLVGLALVTAACGCAEPQAAGTQAVAAAVTSADATRFYLGQPGIERETAAIESGTLLAGGWTRIGVPRLAGSTHFDLAAADPVVEFWHSFGVAPGCADNIGPYVAKWSSGAQGVSGTVDVAVHSDDTYEVSFDFSYAGDWDLPCGHIAGQWSFGNQYLSIPE